MDYFYDGQIRRYVTQFMRVFIGFKYKTGGTTPEERHVPVMYGDLTRQVANIIKENSENKLPTVPRIACYITGLELDTTRLADATFVSKVNIREQAYNEFDSSGDPLYLGSQGAGYTVERLMPTPFKLSMKADLWTSNTDQKLQLLEQILVLFNPSLEIQTTDNYLDWTSLSVLNLGSISFSSRSIPVGAESDIDICSIDFDMPIYITPPAKVKKLGIIKSIIANIFTESGDVMNIQDLVYNPENANSVFRKSFTDYSVILLKSSNNQTYDYDLSVYDINQLVQSLNLEPSVFIGNKVDWNVILEQAGGYTGTSLIHFTQPSGYEISGTFAVNEVDPSLLLVSLDPDTIPANTLSAVTAIIDPYSFNPVATFGGINNIPTGTKYLMLDDVNNSSVFIEKEILISGSSTKIIDTDIDLYRVEYLNPRLTPTPVVVGNVVSYDNVYSIQVFVDDVEVTFSTDEVGGRFDGATRLRSGKLRIILDDLPALGVDGTTIRYVIEKYIRDDVPNTVPNAYPDRYSGPAAWKNLDGSDIRIKANSIIEWDGSQWSTLFDPASSQLEYVTNLRTGIQYKWDGLQWLKSFEGEYATGYWRFDLDA